MLCKWMSCGLNTKCCRDIDYNGLGYNGEMLDVEEPVDVEEATIPADEEVQIEHLVAKNLIKKAGGLFKWGYDCCECLGCLGGDQ